MNSAPLGAGNAVGMCAPYHRAVNSVHLFGAPESRAMAPEADHDALTVGSYPHTNPDHAQGAFVSSWRAGNGKEYTGALFHSPREGINKKLQEQNPLSSPALFQHVSLKQRYPGRDLGL